MDLLGFPIWILLLSIAESLAEKGYPGNGPKRQCVVFNIPHILCAPDVSKVSVTPYYEYVSVPQFTNLLKKECITPYCGPLPPREIQPLPCPPPSEKGNSKCEELCPPTPVVGRSPDKTPTKNTYEVYEPPSCTEVKPPPFCVPIPDKSFVLPNSPKELPSKQKNKQAPTDLNKSQGPLIPDKGCNYCEKKESPPSISNTPTSSLPSVNVPIIPADNAFTSLNYVPNVQPPEASVPLSVPKDKPSPKTNHPPVPPAHQVPQKEHSPKQVKDELLIPLGKEGEANPPLYVNPRYFDNYFACHTPPTKNDGYKGPPPQQGQIGYTNYGDAYGYENPHSQRPSLQQTHMYCSKPPTLNKEGDRSKYVSQLEAADKSKKNTENDFLIPVATQGNDPPPLYVNPRYLDSFCGCAHPQPQPPKHKKEFDLDFTHGIYPTAQNGVPDKSSKGTVPVPASSSTSHASGGHGEAQIFGYGDFTAPGAGYSNQGGSHPTVVSQPPTQTKIIEIPTKESEKKQKNVPAKENMYGNHPTEIKSESELISPPK